MSLIISLFTLSFVLSACVAPDAEATVQPGTQALEAAAPTQAPPLLFDQELYAELSRSSPVYAFDFSLSDAATVEVQASAADERAVTLRLELYDRAPRRPTLLAHSEAGAGATSWQLSYAAQGGRYRMVIRGARSGSCGAFSFLASCSGPGCPSVSPGAAGDACLFGSVFSDIRSSARLQITREIWLRSTAELTDLESEQLLRAVQQSSHTDVTTAAEALSRVDQQEIRVVELVEIASGREFRVYEYGVGDNSYGAFFERDSAEVAASIHDGDLLDCKVTATDGSGT